MTKQALQTELKEKVKAGIKPSDLKKLKRSKSEGDIPKAPPLPTSIPLQKSQSQLGIPLTQPNSEIKSLKDQVQFHSETAQNYLKSLQTAQARVTELEERLRNSPELDQALFTRHQSLKNWFAHYQTKKQLEKELKENIDEASNELISQDQTISNLRTEIKKLKQTNESLSKDLGLAQRAVKFRSTPLSPLPENYPWLPSALTFCLLGIVIYLIR